MQRRGLPRKRSTAAALVLTACVASCGGPGHVERPRPSLVSEVSALPAFVTPAVWRYHPPQPARVNAELALPSGERVLAGRRGERWLVSKSGASAEAASVLAPEDLVGILTAPGGGLVFVGSSGVSYEARSPIAPFFRSSAPLEPLVSVSTAGAAIVGIRRDRGLLRSEDGGGSWKPVGPNGPKFVSVILAEDGRGLALAVPEALYETKDGGQSYARLTVPTVGAFGFERLSDRGIGVVAALGSYRYRESPQPMLEALSSTQSTNQGSSLRAGRGPDAQAMSEGRAVATGGTYYELALGEKAGSWQLISGPMQGPLASRAVAELSGCRALRLAAFERSLSVACFRAGVESASQPIELFFSDDGGASLRLDQPPVDGNLTSFRSALGADGTLLLSGVCPSYAAGSGCAPQGIARRSRATPKHAQGKAPKPGLELRAAATPSLSDAALALAFSVDGRVAYAVGRRTKGGVLAMFVSRDGGKTFEAEDLALPTGEEADGEERWENSAAGVRVDALSPAEDGSVGLAVSRYRSRVWVVLDEAGRVLSVAKPPEPGALLGVAGSRALVVSPASNEAWESLDAGASFQSLGRLPIDLCDGDASCEVPLSCTPYGCAVGRDVSRLGWGGQSDEDGWVLPAPPPPPVDYSVPRLKTPISCQLDASPWQALDGVSEFPTAFSSAIGKAVWFTSGSDATRAAVWVWVAAAGKARAVREDLLLPHERGRGFALTVSDQVEGVAALRYPVPDTSAGSAHLSNVELGWLNLLEGRTRRAAIADAGAYAPGDFARGARGLQEAEPALLSIAEGGIYLRIHRAAGDNQPTYFFDGKGSEKIPPVTWPTVGVRGTHSEMAHVDGEHVPLLLVGRGSAVLRARFQGGKAELDAFANGALDPARFGLTQSSTIAYAGSRAGQVIETFDSASARASAQLFPFRARGEVLDPPIDVPTQLSLPERPDRCNATAQAATPRIVAAHYPGTRHPVIVADGGDAPQAFLTSYAVLHGTPGAPCVASFDAEPIAAEGATAPTTRLILPYGDLGNAYAFRASAQNNQVRVEYHSISCKLDPSAEVPQELYRAPGALVPRAR